MKRPSADIPKDRRDSDETQKTGKRHRIVTIEPDINQPWQQDIPIPTVQPDPLHDIANEGHSTEIALVDLFAGLRTVHVAAKTTGINFVLCASAEKCPFANKLAKKNKIYDQAKKDWAKDCNINISNAEASAEAATELYDEVLMHKTYITQKQKLDDDVVVSDNVVAAL